MDKINQEQENFCEGPDSKHFRLELAFRALLNVSISRLSTKAAED